MKKSEMLFTAQLSVIDDDRISSKTKLAILRNLMKEEDLAIFKEKQKEEENLKNLKGE